MTIISRNLRKCRIIQGLTIRELASKVHLDESVIGKYEQGTFIPTDKTLVKLAYGLNVSLMALIMSPYQMSQYLKSDYQLTGRDIQLCQLILDMTDDEFADYLSISKMHAKMLKDDRTLANDQQTKQLMSILRCNAHQSLKLIDPSMITPESIKLLRKKLGITQEQLAERLGTIRITVSMWERGINKPKARYVKQLLAMMDNTDIIQNEALLKMTPHAIKHLRATKGWSQEDLAKKLGTSHQLVNRWEKGKNKPLKYASKLCELLDSSDSITILTAGEIIKGREKHNFSRADLARAVGVWETTVKNWENSKCKPSKRNNAKLKKVFAE